MNHELEANSTLSPYRIVSKIGVGGTLTATFTRSVINRFRKSVCREKLQPRLKRRVKLNWRE